MTRKEQIIKASEEYEKAEGSWAQPCTTENFIDGAEWADEHPKSSWISVKDDLPYNYEKLTFKSRGSTKLVLVRTRKATYFVNFMINKKSKWKWFCAVDDIEDEIEYWMIIPELPKK